MARPLGASQSVRELGQDLIAGGVTEGVVDGFEVVQIAEQQPDAGQRRQTDSVDGRPTRSSNANPAARNAVAQRASETAADLKLALQHSARSARLRTHRPTMKREFDLKTTGNPPEKSPWLNVLTT